MFYKFSDIVSSVLHGADDVAKWWTGNHQLGYWSQDEEGGDVWIPCEYSSPLLASFVVSCNGSMRLHLSKREETALQRILCYLEEYGITVIPE